MIDKWNGLVRGTLKMEVRDTGFRRYKDRVSIMISVLEKGNVPYGHSKFEVAPRIYIDTSSIPKAIELLWYRGFFAFK